MHAVKFINGWALFAIILVLVIVVGGMVIWLGYSQSQAIEISLVPDPELRGEIYIGGEVNNPGFYSFVGGESIEDVIQAAGGVSQNGDLGRLELFVPDSAGSETLQKVNINQAEGWLLAALPGIGEVRAKGIIDYRRQNGPFRNINELVKVEGIGTTTYEKIKHLITISD